MLQPNKPWLRDEKLGKKTHLTLSLENAFTFLCIKPQETRKTPFTPYMVRGYRTTRTKF